MSKRYLVMLCALVMACAANPLAAQENWRLDIRGDVAFAVDEPGNAELDPGFGFEANLARRVMPHLAIYGGWGWHRFSADQSFAGTEADFEETGYNFGLHFVHPLAHSPVNYYVRLGGVFNHIETENQAGNVTGDSDHELGWQVGAGLVVPLGGSWDLMPGMRYRSFSTDLVIGNTVTEADLSYFSLGASLSKTF